MMMMMSWTLIGLCKSVRACLVCRDAQPADMNAFAAHLANNYVPNTVIVDATASSHMPERYMEWMQVR